MSNTRRDGGPAFPRSAIGHDCGQPYGQQDGLSQRDYIAIQAMTGILSAGRDYVFNAFQAKVMSESAYKIADAMLAARENRHD